MYCLHVEVQSAHGFAKVINNLSSIDVLVVEQWDIDDHYAKIKDIIERATQVSIIEFDLLQI